MYKLNMKCIFFPVANWQNQALEFFGNDVDGKVLLQQQAKAFFVNQCPASLLLPFPFLSPSPFPLSTMCFVSLGCFSFKTHEKNEMLW